MEILKRLLEPIVSDQINPPVLQNLQELPFGEISWENFEKLINRLVLTEAEVKEARPYGLAGDAQDGIDVFAYLENGTYKVYQCKREDGFSPKKIADAIMLFLDKDWSKKAATFVLCTHESLRSKVRSDEITKQREGLKNKNIGLEIWDAVELNSKLKKYPQLVYDFFGLTWTFGFCGPEVASTLKLRYPIPDKNVYPEPSVYLRRSVVQIKEDQLAFLFEKKTILFEVTQEHRRIALLAWGLNGKSTELEQLAYLLSQKGTEHVFLIKFENYVDEDITSLVPNIEHIPQNNLVVLLDGLDEVLPDKFELIRRKIVLFLEKFPLTTMVVSCRTNFYTNFGEETDSDTLKGFMPYRLQNLDATVFEQYLSDSLGVKKKSFVDEIIKRELSSLLNVPYYLIKLSKQYNLTGKVADSKAALFLEDLNELVEKEIKRRFSKDHQTKEKILKKIVQKLAFVMEAMGTNQITTADLEKIVPKEDDFYLIKDSASIFYSNEAKEKNWRFYHHNLQEFLAANIILKRSFSEVTKLIAIGPDYHVVKPLWVNSILFMMDILPDSKPLKMEITDWLIRYNKQLLVKLDPERLKPQVRIKLFNTIYSSYKADGRRINNNLYRNDDLARFSESPEIADLLVSELKNGNDLKILANALSVAMHFRFRNFPDQLDKLKKEIQKLLERDASEINYLVLNVYFAHFELSSYELQEVFVKYQDSTDEDVRVGLFEGILRFDSSVHYLEYMLRQAVSLIKEKHESYRNGNKKTHLSSGGKQLSAYLEKIKTKNGLLTIFTALEGYLLSLKHSGSFSNTTKVLLKQAAQFPQDADLTEVVARIFKTDHSYILHDMQLSEYFTSYFKQTDQLSVITGEFIKELKVHDATAINSISILANREDIDLLKITFKGLKADDELIRSLDHFLEKNNNPNLDYFRILLEVPEKIVPPKLDFTEIEAAKYKRDLAALFSKDAIKQEIKLIFSGFQKTRISYSDIRYDDPEDYWSEKYCGVARDLLELRPSGGKRVLNEVLENIEMGWEVGYYQRIYDYWVSNPKADLDEDQARKITNWCNLELGLKKFSDGIHQYDAYNNELDSDLVAVCFFMRKLNIQNYEKEVYLDMLSFVKHSDGEIDIFDYVAQVPGLTMEEFQTRVLLNLSKGISNYTCLQNHLKFIEDNNIHQAADLLLPYLEEPKTLDKHRILKIYLGLKGDLAKLEKLLPNAKDFEELLIIELVKINAPYIFSYLKNTFRKEIKGERKLFLAKQLLSYQYKAAFDFYREMISTTKIVPDDSSPYNPLYAITEVSFTSDVLELIKLAHDPSIIRESFKDLRSISFTCLRNISLFEDNHKQVLKKVQIWVLKQRIIGLFSRNRTEVNVENEIKLYLESIQQQYNVAKSKVLTINEALSRYDAFNKH